MNEELFHKEKINNLFVIFVVCGIMLVSGFCFGYRYASLSTNGTASTTVSELKSDISRLKSENESLSAERDRLIADFSTSNGKLESIVDELRRCSQDISNQSAEYSERIEAANGNVLEYNRIYTERVYKLCDTMEGTINSIAAACGYDFSETR